MPPRGLLSLERRIRGGEEITLARLEQIFAGETMIDRLRQSLESFLATVQALAVMTDGPPSRLIEAVLERSGYRAWLRRQDDGEQRVTNLLAFRALAERSESANLGEFLDEVSLAAEVETGSGPEGLCLSTIHAAKGLEWPVVFVAGLEEGLLPHARALNSEEGAVEEELRLCYVAVTRAVDRLYLSYARRRPGRGRTFWSSPSRFLQHIPPECFEAPAHRLSGRVA
jgi:DNA helicase-2/ATP-dependent DNA helicase PcrA